jgi:tetratricopeptide (TPR) repeat protein
MPRIFISYRRVDTLIYAGRIYDRLVDAFGLANVFMDVNNDSIPLGRDFREVLGESVAQCDVLLAVIGKQWLLIKDEDGKRRLDNPDDFVRIEIETALKRKNCLVIPATVDNTSMPSAKDLPDSLKELPYKHAAVVRNDPDFHPDVNKIIREIEKQFPRNTTATMPQLLQVTPPVTPFNIYDAIDRYHGALDAREWYRAQTILSEIRASTAKVPRSFNVDAHEKDVLAEIEKEDREHEYNLLRRMAKSQKPNIARIQESLKTFWETYPRYDPDHLERFMLPDPPSMPKKMNAKDYLKRAEAYYQKKEYEHAVIDCTEAIRLNPQLIEAYNYRGLSYHYGREDYDKAIADFTEALHLNPEFAEAYNNRAASYNKKKEYSQAISDYTETIRLNPENGSAYYNRGFSYRHSKKNYDLAVEDFTEAIRLNLQNAEAYIQRGTCYHFKGKYALAVEDYEAALRINPGNSTAIKNLQNSRDMLKRQQQ